MLVVLPGLEPEHANPTGMLRRWELRRRAPFAEHATVVMVRRSPGLAAGCTMAEIEDVPARAVEHEDGEAVAVLGESTGGSVALQLAADHPDLVRRLVVVSGACRLSDLGPCRPAEQARRIAAGQPRRAAAATAPAIAGSALTAGVTRDALRFLLDG